MSTRPAKLLLLHTLASLSILSLAFPVLSSGSDKPMMAPPPLGIMGSHLPPQGKIMFSLKHKQMNMQELMQGNHQVTENQVLAMTNQSGLTYRMLPTRMTGEMTMLGLMLGLQDSLSLMVMAPWIKKTMTMKTFNGAGGLVGSNTASTEGLGDIKVGALFNLNKQSGRSINAGLALSLPSGDITKDNRMLMMNGTFFSKRATYGMQLGSGTYDLVPSLTYTHKIRKITLGMQYHAVIRLENENEQGWRRGHIHKANAWLAYQANSVISGTTLLQAAYQGDIKGNDAEIDGRGIGADSRNYGGTRYDLSFGLNYKPSKNIRLGLEYTLPLYEVTNGVHLGLDNVITLGASMKL